MLRRKCYAKNQALKTSVPYGSTKVEWLQNTTGMEGIDTQIVLQKSNSIIIDFSVTKISDRIDGRDYQCFLGVRENYDDNHTFRFALSQSSNNEFILENNSWSFATLEIPLNERIDYLIESKQEIYDKVSVNGNLVINETNTKTDDYNDDGYEHIRPLYLFTRNVDVQPACPIHCRFYNCKMSIDNMLMRNYIPSIDKTGTPCMFDLVSRKNFYNAGTGQFIYPTTSTTYSLRKPQAEWAKITDTGVHKIYHTPIGYEGSLEEYAIENGYKRLIETESPNEEGKYYSFRWVETDDTLTTEWFEIDPPQEEIYQE